MLFHLAGVSFRPYDPFTNLWSGLCVQLENYGSKMGKNDKYQTVVVLVYPIWLKIQNFQAILVQGTASLPNISSHVGSQGCNIKRNQNDKIMAIFF